MSSIMEYNHNTTSERISHVSMNLDELRHGRLLHKPGDELEMQDRSNAEQDVEPHAPLISRVDSEDGPDLSGRANRSSGNVFLWTLTISACVGGMLFGYDTGVISSTLVSIGTDLSSRPLSTLDKGLITSCTSLFALIASPIAGVLADRSGRKLIIIASDVLFVLGALWQAITTTVWGMILGRSLVGLAIGGASLIVPLYIAELAPGHLRGRLTTVQLLFITGGQVVAYVVGWAFSSTSGGWRWMVGLGAVPALTQLAMLTFMPETPRYLAKKGQEDQARAILKRVYRGVSDLDAVANGTLNAIKKEIREEEEIVAASKSPSSSAMRQTLRSLLFHPPHARALTIACMLQALQQLCGFNSLMYFSATIFDLLEFGSPTLTSLSIALTNFAFTVAAFYLIDRIGRRRILLRTIPIMVLALFLCSLAFTFISLPTQPAGSRKAATPKVAKLPAYAVVAALLLYVSSYATGLGPVPWQQSELFPLQVRSLGSSFATATNWGCNTIVGLTFLPMMEALTPGWTFVCYAIICVLGWVAIWIIYPETMNMEIEEVSDLLKEGWGVQQSMERVERSKRTASRAPMVSS